MDRVRALPSEVREELVPVVEEALEQAVYRSRVLTIARDALERFRLDLEMTKFDLEATRREKERLRSLIDDSWE
jgi:nitric oxide reductase activation protein